MTDTNIPGLTYDDPTHQYRYNGRVVPSVTQILKPISGYDSVPENVLAVAAARGTAVHYATELFDRGLLDYSKLDDSLLGYLDAWERFLYEKRPVLLQIESKVWHPLRRYAGTMDREMLLDGEIATVDLKSSFAMMPTTGPQTAAYQDAANQSRQPADRIKKRFGLHLKSDGTYVLHPFTDPGDLNVFNACLAVYRWKERHGAKP